MKIFKKLFIGFILLATVVSLSYGGFIAKSMYEKFNDTVKWKNSSLLAKIHQVPPDFAKNYISIDDQKILEVLTDVNIALQEIKKDNGIDKNKANEYWELHDYAKEELSNNDSYKDLLNKGVFSDFSLYLKTDKAINSAYDSLQIAGLEDLEKTFASRLAKQDSKLDKTYLNKLNSIFKDYDNLAMFSQNAVDKLGIVKKDILKVDVAVDKSTTKGLLNEIYELKLTKFAHIQNLVSVLKSEKWDNILAHNKSTLEYYSWKDSQKILEGLLQSDYVAISSFKDVADVLAYDPYIGLEQKANHTINKDSKVKAVYYNGKKIKDNLYIKRGSKLNFVIDYKYTENPKSTITIEYVDIDGKKLEDKSSYEGYVGSPFSINRKVFEGYILKEINGSLDRFPKNNAKVQLIYDVEPEPEPEPEVEEPETEEPADVDSEVEKDPTNDKQDKDPEVEQSKDDNKTNADKKDDKKDNKVEKKEEKVK